MSDGFRVMNTAGNNDLNSDTYSYFYMTFVHILLNILSMVRSVILVLHKI